MVRNVLLRSVLILLVSAPLLGAVYAASPDGPEAAPGADDPPLPAPAPDDDPAPAPDTAAAPPAEPASAGAIDADGMAGEDGPDIESPDKPYWRTNLFGRFFRDQKFLLTTWWPAEFRRPAFTSALLAGVALATTSNRGDFEGADKELGDYVNSESSGRTKNVAQDFTFLGNLGPGALLIGAGYLIGRVGHHDRLAEASSLSAEALLSTGIYTTFLKSVSARTRPANGGSGDFFQYSPQGGQVPTSFPSGHAAAAFTVAGVFSGVYSDSKWVPWVAYGTAGLVGWSRVALHRHFPSDVLVGAVLGSSIGRMTVARNDGASARLAEFAPFIDPETHTGGVVWTHRW